MSFKLLSLEKIPKLLRCLEMKLPKAAMLHNVAQAFVDKRFPESIQTKFYSLDGTFNSDFIFAVQLRQYYESEIVVILAPDNPSKDMLTNFENSMNWSSPLAFAAVDSDFVGHVKEMCIRNGKLWAGDPCYAMYMTIPKALSLSVISPSETVTIRELTKDCAAKVTNRWKFSEEGTLQYMEDIISNVCSAGVFVGSELVSWVVLSSFGSIMALHTEEEHRRKGYAELTMKYCMKLAGERGLISHVQIELPNSASKALMEKCGLEFSHDVEWVIYKPAA